MAKSDILRILWRFASETTLSWMVLLWDCMHHTHFFFFFHFLWQWLTYIDACNCMFQHAISDSSGIQHHDQSSNNNDISRLLNRITSFCLICWNIGWTWNPIFSNSVNLLSCKGQGNLSKLASQWMIQEETVLYSKTNLSSVHRCFGCDDMVYKTHHTPKQTLRICEMNGIRFCS